MRLGTWHRQLVGRAYRARARRRQRLLTMFAERGWQRPHQGGLVALLLVGGLLGAASGGSGGSVITDAFPGPASVVWFLVTVLGAAVVLWGTRRHTATGLMVERAGLTGLAGWLLAFPLVGLATVGWDAAGVSVLVCVFAVSNLVRAFHLSVDLYELEVIVAEAHRLGLEDTLPLETPPDESPPSPSS